MFKLIVLFLTLGLSFGHEDCDMLGVLFYEDIGCKPVKVEGKTCPVQFNCDDFTIKNDSTCLFQSKILKSGDAVDDAITLSSCRVGCFCNPAQHGGAGLFTCAILDCPEWLRGAKPECYPTYTLGQCCANGKKCESDDGALAKCEVNGRSYSEGQKFYPKNTCLECVCQKGFAGKLTEPFCKRRICSEQISDSDKLADNCAPVYFGEGCHLCCPDDYICPKDTDVVKKLTDVTDSDLKCKFGKRMVKLGDGVETKAEYLGKTRNVKCECIIPPFLTCKENIVTTTQSSVFARLG